LGSCALAEGVVEDHNIGPLRVALPVLRLRNEAIGNVLLALRFDKIPDVVAFLEHFPGDVADQTGK